MSCLLGLQHRGQFCGPRGQREGQSYLGLMRSRVSSASDMYRKRSEGRKGIRELKERTKREGAGKAMQNIISGKIQKNLKGRRKQIRQLLDNLHSESSRSR